MRYSFCDGWEFTPRWSEEFLSGGGKAGSACLTVHTEQTEDVTVHFTVKIGEEKRWS